MSRPKETLNGLGEEQLPTWKALKGKSFSDVFDYMSQNERLSVAHFGLGIVLDPAARGFAAYYLLRRHGVWERQPFAGDCRVPNT